MLAVLAVLVVGGVAGCLARYWVSQTWPTPVGGWPLGTFMINLSGCLGLGFLLEHLTRQGPDVGARRLVRLGVGTGFLGTYTTYSTLAVEVDLLTRGGDVLLALGYAAASLLAGLGLAAVGVGLAVTLDVRRRQP